MAEQSFESVPRVPGRVEAKGNVMTELERETYTFATLYEEHYPRIFNYVMRSVMNVTVAEDIVSEAFARALHGLPDYKGGRAQFQAWLYRIATNVMMDHFRRSAKEKQLQSGHVTFEELSERGLVPSPVVQPGLDQFERYQALHRALLQLDDIYRLTIVLYYFEQKRLKEVAGILNCTVVAVKWRLHRARKQLGAILDVEEIHYE